MTFRDTCIRRRYICLSVTIIAHTTCRCVICHPLYSDTIRIFNQFHVKPRLTCCMPYSSLLAVFDIHMSAHEVKDSYFHYREREYLWPYYLRNQIICITKTTFWHKISRWGSNLPWKIEQPMKPQPCRRKEEYCYHKSQILLIAPS